MCVRASLTTINQVAWIVQARSLKAVSTTSFPTGSISQARRCKVATAGLRAALAAATAPHLLAAMAAATADRPAAMVDHHRKVLAAHPPAMASREAGADRGAMVALPAGGTAVAFEASKPNQPVGQLVPNIGGRRPNQDALRI